MTHSILKPMGALSVLLLSAACDGSTTTGEGTMGIADMADAPEPPSQTEVLGLLSLAEKDADRIAPIGLLVSDDFDDTTDNGVQGTKWDNLVETISGNATYTGAGRVEIFTRTAGATPTDAPTDETVVEMIGLSTVTVNFESDTFTGRVRDMVALNLAGETDIVSGELRIRNGDGKEGGFPTQIVADAAGELTAFEESYDINVDLEGLLRGTNPGADIPVTALTLQGEGTVANSTNLVELSIVGDKVATGKEGYFDGLQ